MQYFEEAPIEVPDADALPAKRLRTQCPEAAAPPSVQEIENAIGNNVAVVNPQTQAQVSACFAEQADTYSVLKEPIQDAHRALPSNFDEDHLETFLRLPAEALPQGISHGKHNYTLRGIKDGAPDLMSKIRIEVHMADRRFYVKSNSSGDKPVLPGITWQSAGSIAQAWELAKAKAEWDSSFWV